MLSSSMIRKPGTIVSSRIWSFSPQQVRLVSKIPRETMKNARLYIITPSTLNKCLSQGKNEQLFQTIKKSLVSIPLRAYHTSSAYQSKGTTAIRRQRAAAMVQSAPKPVEGTIFQVDKRSFFLVLTAVAVLQSVFFLGAAEFYWQYDISVVDGLNAGSNLLSRLVWPAFFAAVGSFVPLTRYFFGSRFVQKLDLLPTGDLNLYTYDFWARPKLYATIPIKSLKPKQFNDQGDYFKFKARGFRWFFIADKKGEMPNPTAFKEVMNGNVPTL